MTRFRSTALTAVTALTVAVTVPAALTARQGAERTVYVTVMSSGGQPVPDMRQEEFSVKQNGEDRVITKVDRASEPLHYAILIDTTPAAGRAVNDIRTSVKAFCELLLSVDPKTEFQLMEFGGAAMTHVDFTSDITAIEGALGKMLPKPSEPVLNEALVEVSKQMAKMPSGSRRVILTINMEPTIESSGIQARLVAEEVRKSGAAVWAVSLQEGTRRDSTREQLLNGLAANTGGRSVVLQGQAGQSQLSNFMRSIAANTFSQYAVTFTEGETMKPGTVTDVTVTRQGVTALSMKWSGQ